jgi:hypothetical protein
MFDFLKTFFQGLIYLLLSPVILAFLAIYMVYSFFVFLFMFIKRVIMFFKGENMKEGMKIDKVSQLHLDNQDAEKEALQAVNPTPMINVQSTSAPQPIIIQTDEQGRLKNIKVLNTNPVDAQPSIENQVFQQLEAKEKDND